MRACGNARKVLVQRITVIEFQVSNMPSRRKTKKQKHDKKLTNEKIEDEMANVRIKIL